MENQEVINYLLAHNDLKLSKEKICLTFLGYCFIITVLYNQ